MTAAAVTPLLVPPRRVDQPRRLRPVNPERAYPPETLIGYWNHRCPHAGCSTWVPNHRRCCATHGRALS